MLEAALTAQASAPLFDSSREVVQDVLAQVHEACAGSKVEAFRLALLILQHTRSGVSKRFALALLEQAVTGRWSVGDEERRELMKHLEGMQRTSPEIAPGERIAAVQHRLRRLVQDVRVAGGAFSSPPPLPRPGSAAETSLRSSSSLPSLPAVSAVALARQERMEVSAASLAVASVHVPRRYRLGTEKGELPKPLWWRERPTAPRQESLHEREVLPKDPGEPSVRWWRARPSVFLRGQPIFSGHQFKVPTSFGRPVGPAHFSDWQRCKVSTY